MITSIINYVFIAETGAYRAISHYVTVLKWLIEPKIGNISEMTQILGLTYESFKHKACFTKSSYRTKSKQRAV